MNAIEILKKDHEEVKAILQSITESKSSTPKKREKLINDLYEAVMLHAKIEEKLIYPLGLKSKELKSLTREAFEEHSAVEMLLKKVIKVPVNDDYWLAKCTVIKENLEHHIEEEEKDMFPALKKLLSKVELEELGESILALKAKKAKPL